MRKVIFLPTLIGLTAALLALSACDAAAGQPSPPPAATSAPAATTIAIPLTTPPTATPELSTSTLEPLSSTVMPSVTPEPPTPAPPTPPEPPTPTLEPLVSNTIPGDGEYDDSNAYNTTANDPGVGPNDGDGIANVTFQFFRTDGQEVYSHTEQNPRYCAFGGGDNGQDCHQWIFSDHNKQWPNGKPAQSGPHKLIVTVRGVRGGTTQDQRNLTLNLDEQSTLEVNLLPPGDSFGDQLIFQAEARDLSVGGENGAGIANVNFQVFNSQGNRVYEHTEQNPRYCAFGGGDNGQDCNAWRFSEHNNTWPDGTPAENGGAYHLQATITAKSGQQITQELDFRIELP